MENLKNRIFSYEFLSTYFLQMALGSRSHWHAIGEVLILAFYEESTGRTTRPTYNNVLLGYRVSIRAIHKSAISKKIVMVNLEK